MAVSDCKKTDHHETGSWSLIVVTVVMLMMLVATTVAVKMLIIFWDYDTSDSSYDRSLRLLSATAIFRHGARAPTKFGTVADVKVFPNGKGQLTELGINDSFELGRFLGARYVKTGFLQSPMRPSEILFLSRANSRCLSSAALVGSGMWAHDGDEDYFTPVPIYSNVENDKLFTYLRDCNVEIQRLEKECGKTPPSQKNVFASDGHGNSSWVKGFRHSLKGGLTSGEVNWEEYEGFIYECLGWHRGKSYIRDGKAYGEIDVLIQLDRHGMPVPNWFARKKKEVYSLFQKMYSYTVGVNDYHNTKLLRLKQGILMKLIMDHLRSQWIEFKQTGHIRKKFTAYSTQDWLIMAFLHSLGCGKSVLGETVPNYNALVIIELYLQNKNPVIKLLYKDNQMAVPKEAVHYVRNCESSPCHMEKFTSCCGEYENKNLMETCDVEW